MIMEKEVERGGSLSFAEYHDHFLPQLYRPQFSAQHRLAETQHTFKQAQDRWVHPAVQYELKLGPFPFLKRSSSMQIEEKAMGHNKT